MMKAVGIWLSPLVLSGSEQLVDLRWTVEQLHMALSEHELSPVYFLRPEDLMLTDTGVVVKGFKDMETFEPTECPVEAIVFRGRPHEPLAYEPLLRQLSERVLLANPYETLVKCSSKHSQFDALRPHLFVPEHRYLECLRETEAFAETIARDERPYVVKLDRVGGQGRVGSYDLEYFITRFSDPQILPRLRRYLLLARAVTGGGIVAQAFLLPRWFHDRRARELKLYVAGNQIIAARHTYSAPENWLTGFHYRRHPLDRTVPA